MNKILHFIATLGLLFFFQLLLAGAEREIVADATGSGTTRQEALHDAMRKAIAKAVGMYVSTKSVLQDDTYKEQIVIASDATVTNYKELSVAEKNGMWFIKIRAQILPNELIKYCPQIVSSKVTETELGNLLNKRDAMKNADTILDDIFQDYFINMFTFKKTNLRLASDDNINSDKISIYVDFKVSLNQKYFLKFQNRLCALLDRMAVGKTKAVVSLDSYIRWPNSHGSQQRAETSRTVNGEVHYSCWEELRAHILDDTLKHSKITWDEFYKDFRVVAFNHIKDDKRIHYTLYVVPNNLFANIEKRTEYKRWQENYFVSYIICSFSIIDSEKKFRRFFYDCCVMNFAGGFASPGGAARDYFEARNNGNLIFKNLMYIGGHKPYIDIKNEWWCFSNTGTLKLTIPSAYARKINEINIYTLRNSRTDFGGYDTLRKKLPQIADEIESKFWHTHGEPQSFKSEDNKNGKQPADTPTDRCDKMDPRTIPLGTHTRLQMVKIGAGPFKMGSPQGEFGRKQRKVTLDDDFYLSQTEITQEQWKAVMKNNPSHFKGDNLPVEQISWDDAMEFCSRLNEAGKAPDGWKFTLPTEAQWEYAARGGQLCQNYQYSGSNTVDDVAWYLNNSGKSTHPVAQRQANELGLYDMSGNVWEWCLDKHDSDRMRRGGGWRDLDSYCRSANWHAAPPAFKSFNQGFRVALIQINSSSLMPTSQPKNVVEQFNLGHAFYYGEGMPQNYARAVEWYSKAAVRGYAPAQNGLGICYALGKGVTKDPTKAVMWFRTAAKQGNADAQYNLGNAYRKGSGVPQNDVEAVAWYRKAAEQGHVKAQEALKELGESW